ncbi:MAG: YcxB family protein [Oscillospiraceae bacterium]|nr:YcxB family protein [Oscillospiraceae bacterium]
MEISNRPLGKKARADLNRWKITKIAGIAVSAAIAGLALNSGMGEFSLISGVFGLVMAYQLFFQRKNLIKKKYAETVDLLPDKKWVRTITFDDKITVADGNNSSVFAYSDYKWASENEGYFLLYRNENIVLRVEKGSFTYGNEKDFLRWISNKLK